MQLCLGIQQVEVVFMQLSDVLQESNFLLSLCHFLVQVLNLYSIEGSQGDANQGQDDSNEPFFSVVGGH